MEIINAENIEYAFKMKTKYFGSQSLNASKYLALKFQIAPIMCSLT